MSAGDPTTDTAREEARRLCKGQAFSCQEGIALALTRRDEQIARLEALVVIGEREGDALRTQLAEAHTVIEAARELIDPEAHPEWDKNAYANLATCDTLHEVNDELRTKLAELHTVLEAAGQFTWSLGERAAAAEAREEALRDNAAAFVAKVDSLRQVIGDAFAFQANHGIYYRGETWVDELEALRAALAPTRPEGS